MINFIKALGFIFLMLVGLIVTFHSLNIQTDYVKFRCTKEKISTLIGVILCKDAVDSPIYSLQTLP